jgi:hypothetical protein
LRPSVNSSPPRTHFASKSVGSIEESFDSRVAIEQQDAGHSEANIRAWDRRSPSAKFPSTTRPGDREALDRAIPGRRARSVSWPGRRRPTHERSSPRRLFRRGVDRTPLQGFRARSESIRGRDANALLRLFRGRRKTAVARALSRGSDLRSVHGLCGVRDRLSSPGPRLRVRPASTSPSTSTSTADRTTAPTAKRAAPCARGPALVFATGRVRSTCSVSLASEPRTRSGASVTCSSPGPPMSHSSRTDKTAVSSPRLLIYALEHDIIDAALVSGLEGDGTTWRAKPVVARTKDDVLDTAKSRYTYCANLLAYNEAVEGGAERIGLVGMGCMASAPGAMQARKAGKVARRLSLTIGCCAPRRLTTRSSRNSSRRSTTSSAPTSSR